MSISSRIRRASLALAIVASLAWVGVIEFTVVQKSGFLDDAFIYLHMAENILELGTARYFPVADNPALLASSPLRLLVLVPSTVFAHLIAGGGPSEAAARWAFALSGPLSGLLFLAFFRRAASVWWGGMLAAAIIARCLESGLQMEGVLLFWCGLAILHYWGRRAADLRAPASELGLLLGLTVLTRVEFGLSLVILCLGAMIWRRETAAALRVLVLLLTVGAFWVITARALGVHPIPTSVLAKLVSGQLELFGEERVRHVLAERIRLYFFWGAGVPGLLLALLGCAMAFAIARAATVLRFGILALLLSYLLLRGAPGNYLWYAENLFVGAVTLAVGVWSVEWIRPVRRFRRVSAAASLALLLLLMGSRVASDAALPWEFRDRPSRGRAYEALGRSWQGHALFAPPGAKSGYVIMHEIGIVAYFGGPHVWFMDRSGLAQPGQLEGLREHPLARLYPPRALTNAAEEYQYVLDKTPPASRVPRLYKAFGGIDPANTEGVCDFYDESTSLCLDLANR